MLPSQHGPERTAAWNRAKAPTNGGFALAVAPVARTVLSTSAERLVASDVTIPTADGAIPGYSAKPQAPPRGKAPLLLVVHEIFGVHEHIKDLCRRFAQQGYFAVAPDLFVRQGDASKLTDFAELKAKIVGPTPNAQVLSDLDAALAWATRDSQADATRLGVTGFCWGGRITWLYAAHQPALKAAVAWYGHLEGQSSPLQPEYPVDVVGRLRAPVLGLYGGKDQSISLESIERMRAALGESQNPSARSSQIHVYPDAGHAFAADYRPSYRQAEAQDGFERLYRWLQAHGV